MTEQQNQYEFDQGRLRAEGRRQEAIRRAHKAFELAKVKASADHADSYEAARIAFEIVKPVSLHPNHDSARAEFERVASTAPDLSEARNELDAAIWRAEDVYRAGSQRATG